MSPEVNVCAACGSLVPEESQDLHIQFHEELKTAIETIAANFEAVSKNFKGRSNMGLMSTYERLLEKQNVIDTDDAGIG